MRKLIVQQWATVDNIVAEDDGGMSFVTAQPMEKTTDERIKASVMEFIDTVDTMIIGANTYAMFKDYWPHATDQGEFGKKLNNLTKFVASTNLKEAPWGRLLTRDHNLRSGWDRAKTKAATRQRHCAVGQSHSHEGHVQGRCRR